MSTSKITGVIDGISDYKSKDYFNLALEDSEQDDNWYIGDGTLREYGQFEKGDKVRITVDDNKGSVTNVEPVGKPNNVMESGANEDGATREGDTTDQSSSVGGSTGSSNPFIDPAMQCALKEACETVRHRDADMSEGNHIEEVSTFANGYYNILKSMGDE